MDGLVRDVPAMTQRAAFEQVFGCRYVKSTVCRHRGVWKRADKSLKDGFERMGPVESALWGEFVKKTDFRREGPRAVKTQHEVDDDAGCSLGSRKMPALSCSPCSPARPAQAPAAAPAASPLHDK